MKRLIVFVVTLLATVGAYGTPGPCADIAGTWTYQPGGARSYVCTQDAGKNFTCTVKIPNGNATCTQTYTGQWNSNGSETFPYTSAYVSGTCATHNWSGFIYLEAGCSQLGDSFLDGGNPPTMFPNLRTKGTDGTTATACEVPGTKSGGVYTNGENASVFNQWCSQTDCPGQYRANFVAALNDHTDANFNFSGREDHEVVTESSNTCLGINSDQGATWDPDPVYDYSVGTDETGYAPDAIGADVTYIQRLQRYYRINFPCSIVYQQKMYICCPGTGGDSYCPGFMDVLYETHNITYIFDDATFEVIRNNTSSGPRDVLQLRKTWRWWDLMIPFYIR